MFFMFESGIIFPLILVKPELSQDIFPLFFQNARSASAFLVYEVGTELRID